MIDVHTPRKITQSQRERERERETVREENERRVEWRVERRGRQREREWARKGRDSLQSNRNLSLSLLTPPS